MIGLQSTDTNWSNLPLQSRGVPSDYRSQRAQESEVLSIIWYRGTSKIAGQL